MLYTLTQQDLRLSPGSHLVSLQKQVVSQLRRLAYLFEIMECKKISTP